MGFYDGPSFSLIKSTKVHNGFVNCNRFSPDGKYLITVSSDKVIYKIQSIVLFDGLTGEKLIQKENAHKMGILKCDWFQNSQEFITCSSD